MRWFLPVWVLSSSACAPEGTPPDRPETSTETLDPCAPSDDPTLEIGLGYVGYEALEAGGTFPLIHGPQGGYHLEIGLFATGVDAEDLVSGAMRGFVDGEELASAFPRLDLRCVQTGRESYGTLLVYNAQPEDLDGKETLITVSVTMSDGTVVETEGRFVIEDTMGVSPF